MKPTLYKNPYSGHSITPEALYNLTMQAGLEEGAAIVPAPMILQCSASGQVFHEAGGVCGFAGVVIKPARGVFVSYLKSANIGYRHYYSGWYIPIHDHNQSYARKVAHASKMAALLCDAGVQASIDSRLD
jgi:hypothetical protein